MFSRLRSSLLRVLRVPAEPEPPFGDPASTRVFRASPKFYSLRLLGWGIGQLFALFGLIVGVTLMLGIEYQAAELRARSTTETAPPVQTENRVGEVAPKTELPAKAKRRNRQQLDELAVFLAKVPPWLFVAIWVLKAIGVCLYLLQLAVTYAALRLDYEMRWYVVTDRSLRIRTGLWKVQELTMSFANLQQVVLSQGPVQRLLGIADVRVQSAGGGGASEHSHHPKGESLHTGYFHGVDNAPEVRDLILARLRHFRETGLGDPDEVRHAMLLPASPPPASDIRHEADAVLAARELLSETRQLHSVIVLRKQV